MLGEKMLYMFQEQENYLNNGFIFSLLILGEDVPI